MNIKQYIETGILDNYVLGLVTESERAEVEQYAKQYPEIQQELDAIENALADYAQLHEVAPPAHLKAKVLEEIDRLSMTTSSTATPPIHTSANRGLLGLLGLLFLLSAGAAFYFYGQSKSVEENLSNQNKALQDDLEDCETRAANLERQNQCLNDLINFMNEDDAAEVTKMNSTDDTATPIAAVYWNPTTEEAFVDVGKLPEPPEGHQYQLWGFVDGTPVSMDMIDLEAETGCLSPVRYIPEAKIYAVSIEPAGAEQAGPTGAVPALGNVKS